MPHVILEHSRSATLPQADLVPFFLDLHSALAATGIVELSRIKGRNIEHPVVVVGDATSKRFIFLSIAVLEGRTEEQRRLLCEVASGVLKRWAAKWQFTVNDALNVEVREMAKESYATVSLA